METTQPLAATIPVHCAFHEMASIHVLKPHPLNPNTHPAKQLAIYAQVIAATGWREPVTVSRRSGFIVSGHGAVEAARLIPTELIPIEYQEYASEAEEVADGARVAQPVAFEECDAGRVVPAILESLEAEQQEVLALSRPYISDDSTHWRFSFVLRICFILERLSK